MRRENWFERALAAVAPEAALKRAAARHRLDILNSGYGNSGANTTKKSMIGWNWRGGSAKEDIEDNLDVLRQRSRDAYMGIPIATGAIKTMRTNVICGGLVPTPQVDAEALGLTEEQAEVLQGDILREFGLWADTPVCDADGVDNFYMLQQLAFTGFLMNGDAIAMLTMAKESAAWQPYDLRIRVVEADRLCSPDGYDRLTPCRVQADGVWYAVQNIVGGVEQDADGLTVAYWLCSRHPLSSISTLEPGELTWHRVEARGRMTGRRNIIHLLQRERAGQRRGVPFLAPVLEALKQLGRYTDAELTAAVVSAMFTVFIEKQNPADGRPIGEYIDPAELIDAEDEGSIELGAGTVVDLRAGEKASFADPAHPTTTFEGFFAAVTKQIAAALEIPPEVLFKTFNANYSAARGALNEFWRVCGMHRDWFADSFCQEIYEAWFAEAVARGRIAAPGFFADPALTKAYTRCIWNGPSRTSLNPVQEVTAAAKRVEYGFSTAEQETAQMTGGSYGINIKQRKNEARQKREVDEIAGKTEGKKVLEPAQSGG